MFVFLRMFFPVLTLSFPRICDWDTCLFLKLGQEKRWFKIFASAHYSSIADNVINALSTQKLSSSKQCNPFQRELERKENIADISPQLTITHGKAVPPLRPLYLYERGSRNYVNNNKEQKGSGRAETFTPGKVGKRDDLWRWGESEALATSRVRVKKSCGGG